MIDLAAVPTRLIQRPLATNETWTQDGRNRLTGGTFVAKTRYTAYADQAGTMYVEESNDGAAWTTLKTVAVTAGNLADSGWVNLSTCSLSSTRPRSVTRCTRWPTTRRPWP